MFSRIHQKLGTAGFVISIVALIVALSGGAYAASNGLSGKQKKEVEKIAKKVSKPGPAGATGPAGPGGAKGDAGAKGADGANGGQGVQGPQGPSGGAGGQGPVGPPGPSCPVGACFLPSEATETGVWGDPPGGGHEGIQYYPISFNLPLEGEPEAVYVKPNEAEVQNKCPGRGEDGVPLAEPGVLCVYAYNENVGEFKQFRQFSFEPAFEAFEEFEGIAPTGGFVKVECTAVCTVGGTWAVTAE